MTTQSDDFDDSILEEYTGDRTACDHCGKQFQDGQIVMAERDGEHVFCDCDPYDVNVFSSCWAAYSRSHKRSIMVVGAMRFMGRSEVSPETITESEEEKRKHFERARKLLDF